MKRLSVALVVGSVLIASGLAGLVKHISFNDVEAESLHEISTSPKDDVIRYLEAREEVPDMITIVINDIFLNSSNTEADFTYTRFYKQNAEGGAVVSMDKVKGHLTFIYILPPSVSQENNKKKRKFLVKSIDIRVLETKEQ